VKINPRLRKTLRKKSLFGRKSMEMETAREASEKFLRKLHREKINTYFEVTMFQTVGYGSIPIDTFLVG